MSTASSLDRDSGGKEQVSALVRGLQLLECFRSSQRFLSMQDLVDRTGLPKATVSRLLHTLVAQGYLEHSSVQERYYLGTGLLCLGFSALGSMGLRQIARPFMRELAEQCSASVGIAARDRHTMVYVENCASAANQNFRLSTGSRVPLATSALGRAYFCGLGEQAREDLLISLADRQSVDCRSDRQSLEEGLKYYERTGFCISVGDWQSDVNAVGIPYRSPDGTAVLAFNICGPAYQLPEGQLSEVWGPRLVNLVRNVDAAMRPI
ncbi:IclR family transcriptional regulator [Cupriavidus lacunae]|uniref:IclR family transcriptional regulator n=1 Tax=Cupriavidus lacunae TaxID=2666307 RepID=A0A370P251_9BURK|nr:IclR family transcriptional regulator [Cupriavidus lacunae]RDK11923.1 IclR family transcriptional regulator [Cupriavidus lacunae]